MKYTYIVDISDLDKAWERMEKRTKYDIKRSKSNIMILLDASIVYPRDRCSYQFTNMELGKFNALHRQSRPDRKISYDYILNMWEKWRPNIMLMGNDYSQAIIGTKGNKGYYLLAGRDKTRKSDGSPAKILWEAMKFLNSQGIKKFDLCGCNKPNTELFKRGFGGEKTIQDTPCLQY
jgi:lipid II:glycine glycyltransferase (peptidoglycan interpeptide bridge formation enzyme)